MRDGRESAQLRDFELDDAKLDFSLEVPLSERLLSELSRTLTPLSQPIPSSPPHGLLKVSWAPGAADEVGLHLPARSQVIGRGQLRYGQPPGEPMLEWVRCSIEGTKWLHRLKFQPLPDAGALAFRFSSRMVDVKSAVAVVSVADLRSRII
jgi:hypothetical protein